MNKKYFALFILILVAIFLLINYTVLNKDFTNQNNEGVTREELIKEEENKPRQTVDVKYQYKDDMHVFVGEIDLPTPCHSLKNKITNNGDITEVFLSIVNDGEVCAQVISTESYVINIPAKRDQTIIFYLDNEIVNLDIFEIPEDQDIYEATIFKKG